MNVIKFQHVDLRTHKLCSESELEKHTGNGWQLEAIVTEDKVQSGGGYMQDGSGNSVYVDRDFSYQAVSYLLYKAHAQVVEDAHKERDGALARACAAQEAIEPERERSWELAEQIETQRERVLGAQRTSKYWHDKYCGDEQSRRKLETDLNKMRKFFGEGKMKEALAADD